MHIAETIVKLETALAEPTVDAPQRQITRVTEWGQWVAAAVVAGYACGSTIGMTADPAWTGDITHRGFIATCQAVVDALREQQSAAEALHTAAMAAARAAATKKAKKAAMASARRAAAWRDKAMYAETAGVGLIAAEDAILRPVGVTVAAVGGISEVAHDKTYHQGRTR